MWANAHCPTWWLPCRIYVGPSIQRRKVWMTHTTIGCRAVTLPRRETRWNLLGWPKLASRSQPLINRSSPYCEDMWRRYCCLISFFRLSIRTLVAKIWPDKVVRWCADGDFFCVRYLQRAACSTLQTCILNSHYGYIMCRSMVDIQYATAEIMRGIKKDIKKDRNHRAKIKCPHLLRRTAIIKE